MVKKLEWIEMTQLAASSILRVIEPHFYHRRADTSNAKRMAASSLRGYGACAAQLLRPVLKSDRPER
jgi:hypothetical protein